MPPGGPNARHGVTLTVCLLRARPTRAAVYPSGHGPGRHPPAPRRCKSRPGIPAAQPMAKPRGHQSIYFVPPDGGLPVYLRRRPSSPFTSGSALRLANSSASHPHLLQSWTPASVVHGLTFPNIHGSFDPVLMLYLLDIDPEFCPHELAVAQILLCPRCPGLYILHDELPAEAV